MTEGIGTLNERLDVFYDALAECTADRSDTPGRDVWPQPVFDIGEGDAHLYPELLHRYYEPLLTLRGDGRTVAELSSSLRYPGRPLHFLYLFMMPTDSKSEALLRTSVADAFLIAIDDLRHGNLVCDGGRNEVLVNDDLAEIKDEEYVDVERNSELSKDTVGELNVLLSSYFELLYFAYIAYGREIHGPYEYSESQVLLVRDYYDFSPDIYDNAGRVDCSTIRLAEVYPEGLGIDIDAGGRLHSDEALSPNLQAIHVSIDDEWRSPTGITEFNEVLRPVVMDLSEEVKSYSREELLEAWVEMQFWATRPLLEFTTRNDWRPPEQVYERIGALEDPGAEVLRQKGEFSGMNRNERVRALKRMLDPRRLGKRNETELFS